MNDSIRAIWSTQPLVRAAAIVSLVAILVLAILLAGGLLILARITQPASLARFEASIGLVSGVGGFVATISAFAIVLLTIRAVESEAEARRSQLADRLKETKPRIYVIAEKDQESIQLVLGHYGGGPAKDVKFKFDPELHDPNGDFVSNRPPFSTGLPLMVPGQRIRIFFADHHGYQSIALYEDKESSYPTSFSIHISCLDVLADDQETEEFTILDFEHLLAGNRTSFKLVETDNPIDP